MWLTQEYISSKWINLCCNNWADKIYKDWGTSWSVFFKNENFVDNTSLMILGSFIYELIRGTNTLASFGLFSKLSNITSKTLFGSKLKQPKIKVQVRIYA